MVKLSHNEQSIRTLWSYRSHPHVRAWVRHYIAREKIRRGRR